MGKPDPEQDCPSGAARIEAEVAVKMLDGRIGLPSIQPDPAAAKPSVRRAWIEFQSALGERAASFYIVAKIGKNKSGLSENIGLVNGDAKRRRARSTAVLRFASPSS